MGKLDELGGADVDLSEGLEAAGADVELPEGLEVEGADVELPEGLEVEGAGVELSEGPEDNPGISPLYTAPAALEHKHNTITAAAINICYIYFIIMMTLDI